MAVASARFWKGREVFVTGGSGFLGYRLSVFLATRGAKVTVLDKRPLPRTERIPAPVAKHIRYVKGTILSKKTLRSLMRKRRFKTIFHLAAEAIESRAFKNPASALDANIRGTWNLLEATRASGGADQILVASSDKAYGMHDNLPYREHYALSGKSPYSCSKSCTDLIAQMYAYAYHMPVAIVRCGNIYGGGDLNGTRLIPDALDHLRRGGTFHVRSDGTFMRDYVYVDDIVSGYVMLAEQMHKKKLSGMAFNLGNNNPLSVTEVLDLLQKLSKKSLRTEIHNSVRHEIPKQYLDSKLATKTLGWKARVSHKKGFATTIRWYESFFKNGGKLDR